MFFPGILQSTLMKKIFSLLGLATFLAAGARAQTTFTAIPASSIGTSAGVQKTSCDIKTMKVVAWDGSIPRVYYDMPGAGTGTFLLPPDLVEPDIVISSTSSGGNLHVLVVGKQDNNFVFLRYAWTGSGFTPGPVNAAAIAPGPYPATINIDAGFSGEYAIVMGHSNGAARVFHGDNASLSTPALVLNGTLPANTGMHFDVCVNTTGNSFTPTNIHLSYVPANGNQVFTNSVPFAGTAFSGAVIAAPVVSGVTYRYPRIASPYTEPCPGMGDLFSVLYLREAAGNNNICQYNNHPTLGISTADLTSGIAPFPTPAMPTALGSPVIAFEKSLATLGNCWAGTMSAWLVQGANPASLIGEKINTNSTPYLTVPSAYYTVTPGTANYFAPAVAGRADGKVVFSYWDPGSNNVFYKLVDPLAPTM